jgi:membrane-associated phospholipid phosphatase
MVSLEAGTSTSTPTMPLLILFTLVGVVGVSVGLLVWRYPRVAPGRSTPSLEAAEAIGETVGTRSRFARRLDPTVATGLALTIALVLVTGGGVLLAVLAYLVRTNSHLQAIDMSVAKWGNRHASPTSMRVLNDLTQLGSIFPVVVGLCVVLAVVETLRERTVWVVAFILTVMAGEEALQLTIKDLAHRLRPTFNPAAAHLGPSFPSGHSATAAAFYATAALLLGRGRRRGARAFLAGGAVAVAVLVAGTRVLLDLHWLSDVIGGLALGFAWFAACAIAYGGRILRFGAGADRAQAAAESKDTLARVA